MACYSDASPTSVGHSLSSSHRTLCELNPVVTGSLWISLKARTLTTTVSCRVQAVEVHLQTVLVNFTTKAPRLKPVKKTEIAKVSVSRLRRSSPETIFFTSCSERAVSGIFVPPFLQTFNEIHKTSHGIPRAV